MKTKILLLLIALIAPPLYACNTTDHHSVLSHYNHAKKIFEGKVLKVGKENQKNNSFEDKATGMRGILVKFEIITNYKNSIEKEEITIGILPNVMADFVVGKKYLIYANARINFEFLVCEKGFETADTSAMKAHEFLFQIPKNHTGYLVEYSEFGKKWAEGKLENGLPTGEWLFYAKSGELQIKGNYWRGEEMGIWQHFYHTTDETYRILAEIINGNYKKEGYTLTKIDTCESCVYKYKIHYTININNFTEEFCYNKKQHSKLVEYKDGWRNGKEEKFDENGRCISTYYFKNEILDGQFFEIQPVPGTSNTYLKVQGSYKEDKKDKEIHFYYENEQLINTKIILMNGVKID